ncbi:MAG: hypothetical protein K9J30_03195 [Bacteroidales bacterium]|nr:hypothetical protein [Bacteroidales bacterium]
MKNTEIILRYLSNELDDKVKEKFKMQLETDRELSDEYHSILKIWESAAKELSVDDMIEKNDDNEKIASILATHDVHQLRDREYSPGELQLKNKLEKMLSLEKMPKNKNTVKTNRTITIVTAAAAAIALLLIIINSSTGINELAANFYTPEEDTYLEEQVYVTRSDHSEGIILFHKGAFKQAMIAFESDMQAVSEEPWTRLYYGISCYESGDYQKSKNILTELAGSGETNLENLTKWYLSLIMIQESEFEEALPYLLQLRKTGKYRFKAYLLSVKMKKYISR